MQSVQTLPLLSAIVGVGVARLKRAEGGYIPFLRNSSRGSVEEADLPLYLYRRACGAQYSSTERVPLKIVKVCANQ